MQQGPAVQQTPVPQPLPHQTTQQEQQLQPNPYTAYARSLPPPATTEGHKRRRVDPDPAAPPPVDPPQRTAAQQRKEAKEAKAAAKAAAKTRAAAKAAAKAAALDGPLSSASTSNAAAAFQPFEESYASRADADPIRLVFGSQRQEPMTETELAALEPVRGHCTLLEKRYFRLLGQPDPAAVRPPSVLRRSLLHVLDRAAAGADYKEFVCDQLKSIRQDLTVQCVRDLLAVRVYEAHARLALEHGDKTEYNQCQAQLRELYRLPCVRERIAQTEAVVGIDADATAASESSSKSDLDPDLDPDRDPDPHPLEFTVYRVLYTVYQGEHKAGAEICALLQSLTPAQLRHPWVRHALAVRSAAAAADFRAFFRLAASAPNHGRFVMRFVFHRIRNDALITMAAAYKPNVPLAFIAASLGFAPRDAVAEPNGLHGNSWGP
jgi:hypothetical protein